MRGGTAITEKDVHDINPANLMILGLIRMFDDPDHMLHGRFNFSDDQSAELEPKLERAEKDIREIAAQLFAMRSAITALKAQQN